MVSMGSLPKSTREPEFIMVTVEYRSSLIAFQQVSDMWLGVL